MNVVNYALHYPVPGHHCPHQKTIIKDTHTYLPNQDGKVVVYFYGLNGDNVFMTLHFELSKSQETWDGHEEGP